MVRNVISFTRKKDSFVLFFLFLSEYIQKSPVPSRRHRASSKDQNIISKPSDRLPRLIFWGATIAVGGLAILVWNQSQSIGTTKLPNLAEYLAQLYR